MFNGAESFNQDISSWDVGNAETMGSMFRDASSFNQDISDWSVSTVEDMGSTFREASSFDQNLSCWDVVSVEAYGHFGTNSLLTAETTQAFGDEPLPASCEQQ